MVAASKLRRAQEQAQVAQPYAQRMADILSRLAANYVASESSPKLLAGTGKEDVHLLVVATSERGLAGAFNSNIVRAARRHADELLAAGKQVKFYLVGKKGRAVIARLYPGKIVHQVDQTHIKNVAFTDALDVAQEITNRFEAGEFDVATLFYAKFQSALVQIPTERRLIPVDIPADAVAPGGNAAVEYEPDEDEILAALLPRNIAVQLFRAFLENAASEQGSRMNAMDNATRNAGDMINRLSIQYNRTRQAAITTELVEIISGAEAL